jgi:hypothetical protein
MYLLVLGRCATLLCSMSTYCWLTNTTPYTMHVIVQEPGRLQSLLLPVAKGYVCVRQPAFMPASAVRGLQPAAQEPPHPALPPGLPQQLGPAVCPTSPGHHFAAALQPQQSLVVKVRGHQTLACPQLQPICRYIHKVAPQATHLMGLPLLAYMRGPTNLIPQQSCVASSASKVRSITTTTRSCKVSLTCCEVRAEAATSSYTVNDSSPLPTS